VIDHNDIEVTSLALAVHLCNWMYKIWVHLISGPDCESILYVGFGRVAIPAVTVQPGKVLDVIVQQLAVFELVVNKGGGFMVGRHTFA